MRVFVAGATGVIGQSLVPRLIEKGHALTAMTRSQERADRLAELGAKAVVCAVYDQTGVQEALRQAQPDVVVHQLTALPTAIHPRRIAKQLAENDRIRVEGTRNLVRATVKVGVHRIVAQSIAFAYAPLGGPVKDEEAPLWSEAPWPWNRTVTAVDDLERQVSSVDGVEGVVLRYGYLYGRGTAYAADGSVAALVRRRQFPITASGSGVFSFVHVDDAASATVSAIEHGSAGTFNIVDDMPAPLRDWLPIYATALDAPEPRRVPSFLARLAVGRYGLYLMNEQRGASNERAKKELSWSPAFATWRTGFREALLGETIRPVAGGGTA